MKIKAIRLVALLLCAVLAIGLTGCVGNLYPNVATVDGSDISAGLYLMAQYAAYSDARAQSDNPDKLMSQKIDDKSATQWIRDKAEENLRRYVLVRQLFREQNLTLSSTAEESVNQTMNLWEYISAAYTDNGISRDTFYRYLLNDEMGNQLFNEMYGEDGLLYVPDDELKAAYADAFAHLRFVNLPVTTAEDETDMTEQVKGYVMEMLAELQKGASLEDVVQQEFGQVYQLLGREFDPETVISEISTSYISYTPDDYETYTAEFLEELKAEKPGAFGMYDMGGSIVLYEKIETFGAGDDFDSMRSSVLSQLKQDEFEDYLREQYSQFKVSWALGARWYYRPSKIK